MLAQARVSNERVVICFVKSKVEARSNCVVWIANAECRVLSAEVPNAERHDVACVCFRCLGEEVAWGWVL